ncbi:Spx/MgsR family RNA polymerase-binding regulatory protein [Aerococcus urinae]|uniref:Spx/MgsR family RNA polymerase-binding regulatory protein n=1 Tax=Aerococcus urinae TaxID=1376 RepID=A0A0X8FEP9_9LACT|nr:Spx/MgsR family RNA polymerase-binding regulatory protein [Aerococcus urinae]AMB95942.1 transcriptional regulator [Aerococcus urinae]MCY3032530.1 Spx/MgsR family RNA polymerase-binding regulatory protein [Aerococcus urinae]MCY3038488.1 Spx/MgsR family RNA polymerase-binding regulatory protein [Aerococcus urinae]MCY3044576.1 Spx/MgsR family RNA polymerase-binding regulatory protein [Aerococcus urinae]MCY3046994.1 Spx/MgsR family RNA polymerase-binding regulatory protein [Aerococcus urinae]
MISLYGLKQCSTSRRVEKAFTEAGVDYQFYDIREQVPSKEDIKRALGSSDRPKQVFNTSGSAYREKNLKDKIDDLSQEEIVNLLASDGMLIKRPLVTDKEVASTGAKEDTVAYWIEKEGK